MLAACALSLMLSPVACPPPEPGLLDRIVEARPPFAHLAPLDDEPTPPVRADAESGDGRALGEDLGEPARDDPPPEPYNPPEIPEPWATLADCESGDWVDGGASFVPGSARWDWAAPGTEVPPWGTSIHHGGLQFAPSTWEWVAPDVLDTPPTYAYDATPTDQIAVAEEVLARQGWEAWPVCSRKVGLR